MPEFMKYMVPAGWQALLCFLSSFLVSIASYFSAHLPGHSSDLGALNYWGPALYFCLFNFILRYLYRGFMYEVSIRAEFLGAAFATGLYLTSYNDGLFNFGIYIMVLSFFHFSEFMAVAATNPKTLSVDSFILNHSVQYGLAAVASWLEFALEYWLFPGMKQWYLLSYIGLYFCIMGEGLRKAAMFTATTNFNHVVQITRQPGHKLVTHGVYAWFRHPSYVGWFYWSLGTQLVLLNPICLVIYVAASWRFFNERVYAEEITLLTFFGREYQAYQEKVFTGLPFIEGFVFTAEELSRASDEVMGLTDDAPGYDRRT